MGQTRQERTWRTPRSTRHVWAQLRVKHPLEPPCYGLLVRWRKAGRGFEGLVVVVDEISDPADPIVVQQWIPAAQLRPVRSDPNRAWGILR
ncbi:hypothetical protein [Rudaeicoccus suwonensis]|uniref:Uncharacterized protein n=1 Tax=Rudaeicoccus suwonensis TaxID=657409 RepID=A0A561DVI3_9MICO|nr:hypothetical protein [Rudaeicoccus suwonensis]TWE07354.1 hypothetical protein BKA23_3367 [Rudaeicoccus suwonensis]